MLGFRERYLCSERTTSTGASNLQQWTTSNLESCPPNQDTLTGLKGWLD